MNAELRSPLLLQPPMKIVVAISSPVPLKEDGWQISLYSRPTDTSRLEKLLTSVTRNGEAWTSEVVPGQYVLKVGHADGSIWSSTDVEVVTRDVFIDLSIPVATVKGSVKRGDRSLPNARLIFGGAQGSERQTLVTDSIGNFSGEVLATQKVEKKWEITVEADDPRVQRTSVYEAIENSDGELRINIELPKTLVAGRVVNEDGSAAAGSLVSLVSADDEVFEQAFSSRDGSFELFGFEPGAYRIHANAWLRSSDVMRIQVGEMDVPLIELVLKKDVLVRGRIRSGISGVVGARLTALPRDARAVLVPGATTDGNGNFELKLPPSTRTFDLIVLSPGFALAAGRVFVHDDKILTIAVGQNGGGIILEMPSASDAVIRHDGAEFPARWFASLSGGSIQSREGWDIATVQNVEGGEYSLCAATGCRSGVVSPHSGLTLSLRPEQN